VAHNFLAYDREQQFLMPPSLAEWLPEDHLAFFLLDVVDELDLEPFQARYRRGGAGRAAYDPKMLLAVLLYAYCIGERSSRRIERRLCEDVAFRVIAANQAPDHATIARFRAEHEEAIKGLFTQALALCATAGLVKVALVAVDGTKIAASASRSANQTAGAIAAEIERMFGEAKAIDEAEDALYGDRRGDELPAGLRRRSERVARLKQLKARLDAEDAARRGKVERHEAKRKEIEASGRRVRGRKMRPKDPEKVKKSKGNTTDPDSRVMKTPQGFIQGYNAHIAVTEDQVILAGEVSQHPVDVGMLKPVIIQAGTELEHVGVTDAIGTVVADAGYFSERNATLALGPELLIAPVSSITLRAGVTASDPKPDTRAAFVAADLAQARQRAGVFERWNAGELDYRGAASEIGLSVPRTYYWRNRYRARGIQGLLSGKPPAKPKEPSIRQRMLAKITSEAGRTTYAKRSRTVEPVFGQIKEPRGIRRFMRRGASACDSEWKLITATHNLLKLWRAGWTPLDHTPTITPAIA